MAGVSKFNPNERTLRLIRQQIEDGLCTGTEVKRRYKTSVERLKELLGAEWWDTYVTKRPAKIDSRNRGAAPPTYQPGHEWAFGKRGKES
jgi:hypothetical protein